MREELGLMSLLINALTVGKQDQFTVTELKDTVMAYARGDVPEVITVLNKEDMEKFKKASVLEKVHTVDFQNRGPSYWTMSMSTSLSFQIWCTSS